MTRPSLRIASLAVVGLFLLAHGTAFAGGWGFYFGWGRDQPSTGFPDALTRALEDRNVPPDIIREVEAADVDLTLDHLTFGLLFDSAPARSKLLSYRGMIGFDIATSVKMEEVTIAGISSSGLGVSLDENSKYGLSTKHTLAFQILATGPLKWWAGPGIRLNLNYYDLPRDIKAGNLIIGGGGETGINLHLGRALTLCLGGGIHWNAFGYGAGTGDVGSVVWGDGPFFFVETSLLYRTGADRGI